ncbi:RNA-directed DNA polymerase, eukaryota [Tanacetum coccineum]
MNIHDVIFKTIIQFFNNLLEGDSSVIMGSQRTKEEDVRKISTSVFITNFPDSFSAKDLFKTFSQYRNVVDSYIPNKRSKTGKRFGFVHFLKVLNVERLLSNLCTLWVGRYRLHANTVRFQRTPMNKNNAHVTKKYEENKSNLNDHNIVKGVKDFSNSYINVVKGGTQSMNVECSQPALVLDDSCFQNQDFSLSLIGKLKEFDSLPNLKKILEEGFSDINICYIGGFWVMFQFHTKTARENFKSHVGVNSWFSSIQLVFDSFSIDERVAWIDIEGVPLRVWSRKIFWIRVKEVSGWAPDFLDSNDDLSDSDTESIELKSNDDFFDKDNEAKEIPRPRIMRDRDIQVRTADERFGSIFNVRGAAAFNSFISTAGLVEVPSGDSNDMSKLAKKLKILKGLIRSWVKDKKDKASILKNSLKKKIADIDSLLENGEASSLALEDRSNAMNNLINLERMESIELAQKAEIQWSIEGDENSKKFHGIINKKRNNLAIRGITVDGNWIEDLIKVKNEFLAHFKERFDSPCRNHLLLDMIFPNKLSTDQSSDLERPF